MGHGVGGRGIIARLGKANFEVSLRANKASCYFLFSVGNKNNNQPKNTLRDDSRLEDKSLTYLSR